MMAGWTEHRLSVAASMDTADLDGPGVTVCQLDSGVPGPTVVVLGGVHGNEVGGILAAGLLTSEPVALTSGRLCVVPVVHEAAYAADSRLGPADGLNLARVFPGRPDGAPTERLAHLITEELMRGADVLIDLHTSSPETDMPLFAGCLDDGSVAGNRAVELALAFGAPMVWTHSRLGPGRTLTVAGEFGIPALYVESPVGGVLDPNHLHSYVGGVRRVLAELGMVDRVGHAAPSLPRSGPPSFPLWVHGDGDVDGFSQATVDGLFQAEAVLLDRVKPGQLLGTVVDPRARLLEEIRAHDAGYIVTLRRMAHVSPGVPVAGIAPERPVMLDLPSDAFVSTPGVLR